MKMSIDDLSVLKRTKQATENVQLLAIKSLFTGDQKRPNHRKVPFSWLFITKENQKIGFGFQKDRWGKTKPANSFQAPRKICTVYEREIHQPHG